MGDLLSSHSTESKPVGRLGQVRETAGHPLRDLVVTTSRSRLALKEPDRMARSSNVMPYPTIRQKSTMRRKLPFIVIHNSDKGQATGRKQAFHRVRVR